MPPLTTAKGQPTGAIYGVVNMLRRLVADYQPEIMVVIFDAKGKTFRDDIYKEYKANRPSMPDDLRAQIEPLHQLVGCMGFPLLMVPGVEADDVIGTLAVQATKSGLNTVISTGDKDMAQLVNANVTLINTMNNTITDEQGVIDKFGVKPAQIIDYLALVGDTSDNIPGVPSCGPKTAAKWLAAHASLEEVIANADSVKGKIGEKLRDSIEFLPMSYELATIKTDVKLPDKVAALKLTKPDVEKLGGLYDTLEFNTWKRELAEGKSPLLPKGEGSVAGSGATSTGSADDVAAARSDQNYETVLTMKNFDAWLAKLKKAELFAFDTETTSLDYMAAEVVGISFAIEPGTAAYVPLAHTYEDAPKQLDRDKVLGKLKPLLESKAGQIIGQHIKESYVLDSTATRHDMDSLAKKYLGLSTVKFEDIAGKGKKQLSFDQIPIEQASHYAAEDADITLQLHHALWPRLEKIKKLKALYLETELPLLHVLSRIECTGVEINAAMLEQQSEEIAAKLEQIKADAYADAGKEFNLGSPKQIQEIFFEEKQFPIIKKTPKGQPSTAEEVLVTLAADYPLPRLILQHRSLAKLKSTYTDKLPLQINPDTGRVHTSYHQAVASTGRLSSTDPNLQNIPVRTEEGRRIREAFVPRKGYRILAADYSQIELRIMAHLSGDEGLVSAFDEGLDVHRATAAEVFAIDVADVDVDQRRKTIHG